MNTTHTLKLDLKRDLTFLKVPEEILSLPLIFLDQGLTPLGKNVLILEEMILREKPNLVVESV